MSGMTAYVIAESPHRDDPAARRYRELSGAAIAQYGGRFLVRGGKPVAREGDWPELNRLVIIEFPDIMSANAWYESPEYQRALFTRDSPLGRRLLFVDEGVVAEP